MYMNKMNIKSKVAKGVVLKAELAIFFIGISDDALNDDIIRTENGCDNVVAQFVCGVAVVLKIFLIEFLPF